jgi:hypothetical protein
MIPLELFVFTLALLFFPKQCEVLLKIQAQELQNKKTQLK